MRSAWMLVATREIVVRVLSRGFLIGLSITVAMVVGLTAFFAFFAYQGNKVDEYEVIVTVGDTDARAAVETAARTAEAADDRQIALTVVEVDSADAAEAALEDDDAWLRTGTDGWTLSSRHEPDEDLALLLETTVRDQVVETNAAEAGTSMAALTEGSELATEPLDDNAVDPTEPLDDNAVDPTEPLDDNAVDPTVAVVAGFLLPFLFLMGAITSGTMIAGSVIEEKQSRLVEIIATAVPLRQLLTGKIIGNLVIALGQNLLLATVGLIGISFTSFTRLLPALSATLIWFVVFFLVGFVAIAAMYATAGALASRNEDLQNTTMPLIMLLMGTYFVTFSADGTFERVLSYIPPASIVSMPLRVLGDDASWWEPLVALAILLAATAGAVLLCERAYRGALMQTGGRLTWRAALASVDT